MEFYGSELILDLRECDPRRFTRDNIGAFFDDLCDKIDMEPSDRHFWDDDGVSESERETEPHLKGTSAIQFITTSNITVHALDILRCVYINVFSCKDFDDVVATACAQEWFDATVARLQIVRRLK